MTERIIMHKNTRAQVDLFLSSQNLNSIGIYGQKGAGKSFLAKYFLENILRIPNSENNPYVKFVDCSQNSGIEEIRGIKAFLRLKVPADNSFSRCVVIEQAELLGIPAQNALLKTLEEPPQGTIIVVTISSKNTVLPTILSRLQSINVLPLAKSQLEDNAFDSFSAAELNKAFLISEGNVGMLMELITHPDAYADLLAAIDEAKILLKSTRFEKLAKIDWLLKNEKYSLEQLMQAMAKVIKSVLAKYSSLPSQQDLVKKLDMVVTAQGLLKHNPSRKLLLTNLFNKL